MKTTVTKLKEVIKRRTANTGYVLSKHNPYYANDYQIKAMQDAIFELTDLGNAEPEKRYTPTEAQLKSLANWIDGLKQTYLHDL